LSGEEIDWAALELPLLQLGFDKQHAICRRANESDLSSEP